MWAPRSRKISLRPFAEERRGSKELGGMTLAWKGTAGDRKKSDGHPQRSDPKKKKEGKMPCTPKRYRDCYVIFRQVAFPSTNV